MESFVKRIISGKVDDECHQYFIRFGKGNYRRRFLLSLNKGKTIKVRGSFEWANDFVNFVRDNGVSSFSGKILMKEKVVGKEGKKKAGSFVYEVEKSSLDKFENAYFYLLDVNSREIILKIKKSLPKPGKNAEKIDDKFCSMDLDLKYWDRVKDTFFWDVPDGVKKVKFEHDLLIEEIVYPSEEKDPAKIREFAKRKGKIIRKLDIDGKSKEQEIKFEV